MKTTTKDRLLEDAMKAAEAWRKDAIIWEHQYHGAVTNTVSAYRLMPSIFILGVLAALLGILIVATVL